MESDKIIYDWLSFTLKTSDPRYVAGLLGMQDVNWAVVKGARGYRERLYYDSISLHYDGRPDMGVWCEMSGQGCRAFESFSTLEGDKWAALFPLLVEYGAHVTRLDVAFDDHSGVLDMDEVIRDSRRMNWISKLKFCKVTESYMGDGWASSVQFGKGEFVCRIYDKAMERHCEPGTHWNRVEIQLRDDLAGSFLSKNLPIGEAFCGVLLNYLRFVKPKEGDSNRWRWPLRPYWKKLVSQAEKLSLYEAPGVEYNMDRLERVVFKQYGNAIDAALEIFGTDDFVRKVKERPIQRNPKYEQLVESFKDLVTESGYILDEQMGKRHESDTASPDSSKRNS